MKIYKFYINRSIESDKPEVLIYARNYFLAMDSLNLYGYNDDEIFFMGYQLSSYALYWDELTNQIALTN